ncbi:hypothetical protein Plhal304r1_c031g0099621 [Plasmopara halstedii]
MSTNKYVGNNCGLSSSLDLYGPLFRTSSLFGLIASLTPPISLSRSTNVSDRHKRQSFATTLSLGRIPLARVAVIRYVSCYWNVHTSLLKSIKLVLSRTMQSSREGVSGC